MNDRIRAVLSRGADVLLDIGVREAKGGLCGGTIGDLLVMESLNQVLQRSDLGERCDALVERSLDTLWQDNQSLTLLTGRGGYLWLFEQLHARERYDFSDIEEVAHEHDTILLQRLSSDRYPLIDYELLYGETGVLHYLLQVRANPLRAELISTLISAIRRRVQPFGDGLIIFTQQGSPFKRHEHLPEEGDLGHAHGFTGTLAVLAQARLQGRAGAEIDDLLDGLSRTLMALRQSGGHSYFGYNHATPAHSRVAWCYGDTCPANALHLAGLALGEQRYVDAAREVVDHIVRRPREAFQTVDYAVCHGVTSVMMMLSEFDRRYDCAAIRTCRDVLLDEALTALENGQRVSDPNVFPDGESYCFLNGMGGALVSLAEELAATPPILPDLMGYFRTPAAA